MGLYAPTDHTESFHMNVSLGASVAFDENGRSDYAESAIGEKSQILISSAPEDAGDCWRRQWIYRGVDYPIPGDSYTRCRTRQIIWS